MPGEVFGRDKAVYLSRECPEHGRIEALVCSDINWFEGLKRFDVAPIKPAHPQHPVNQGCPLDCGLCAAHRQVAGTMAIEISNRCNANCPVCLGDNRGTFEMSVAEIRELVEGAIRDQGQIGVLTLSGGEPTIHPQFFEILSLLDRPEIGRINLNSNGLRMAQDAKFVDQLRQHPKVYVSLHFDGRNAEQIRGTKPELQEQALDRLCEAGIGVVPLILGVRDINDGELGTLVPALLQRSKAIKTVIVSLMAYTGANGGRFKPEPLRRLTIPDAVDSIAAGSGTGHPPGGFHSGADAQSHLRRHRLFLRGPGRHHPDDPGRRRGPDRRVHPEPAFRPGQRKNGGVLPGNDQQHLRQSPEVSGLRPDVAPAEGHLWSGFSPANGGPRRSGRPWPRKASRRCSSCNSWMAGRSTPNACPNAVASICCPAIGGCPVAATTPSIASGTRASLDFESQIVLHLFCPLRLFLKRFANLP